MTRFARAAGSKSNNARVVEEATSWADMKKQLLESQDSGPSQETKEKVKKIKAAKKLDQQVSSEWAEFGSEKLLNPNYLQPASVEEPKIVAKESKKKKLKSPSSKTRPQESVAAEESVTVEPKEKKKKKIKNEQPTENSSLAKPQQPKKQDKKRRAEKELEGTGPKRRKPFTNTMYIDGREIEVEQFDGFPILATDAARLRDLKKKMFNEGIPRAEVNKAMKLERRRAEKALSRESKKVCFNCRQPGHMMSNCPQMSSGACEVCFKCGSTEHKSPQCKVSKGEDFKFSTCFVCGESGHISRQCPDNPRGLYPQGGGCRICGDVTHLKRDCPQLNQERKDNAWTLPTAQGSAGVDTLDDVRSNKINKPVVSIESPRKNKIIKF